MEGEEQKRVIGEKDREQDEKMKKRRMEEDEGTRRSHNPSVLSGYDFNPLITRILTTPMPLAPYGTMPRCSPRPPALLYEALLYSDPKTIPITQHDVSTYLAD